MAGQLILNRFRILETRGKGGFGTVDVAWDSRLQRRVAIKRIPLAIDETDLPGIQEARTAALLNDARIVNVLDFEVTGTEALIIMENVDGPTLGTLLAESRELLDLDIIATIASDVAGALEYAHENQVLHLDIKPDNILIDHKGHIKVSDFGLSELSGTAGFAEPQGGTIGYMPPEQLTQQDVDARTDLWALAMLLYQLLTGSNPFLARTASDPLARILNDPLPLPSALRPELDPAIDEVLVRALMADRELRHGSVAEFLAELSPWLGTAQSGRRRLKHRVNSRDLDEIEFTDDWHQEETDADGVRDEALATPAALWGRVPARLRGALERLAAALACASFALVGLSGFGLPVPGGTGAAAAGAGAAAATATGGVAAGAAGTSATLGSLLAAPGTFAAPDLSFLVLAGVIALIALGGFIVPQLGGALASLVLVAGVIARGAVVTGIVLAVLLVAWWLLVGRRGRAETTVVMLTPLLAALWLGFAAPLLAGLFLPWRRALPSALMQGLLLVALVALTGEGTIAHTGLALPPQDGIIPSKLPVLLAAPTTWMALAAFVLAALVTSLLAARGTVASAVLATTLGTLVLALLCIAAPLAMPLVAPLSASLPPGENIWLTEAAQTAVGMALSFILVLTLSLTGVTMDVTQTEEV
jgi:hypothetical protein